MNAVVLTSWHDDKDLLVPDHDGLPYQLQSSIPSDPSQ